MIEAFSLKTAHLFGDALASQARLLDPVSLSNGAPSLTSITTAWNMMNSILRRHFI